MLSEKKVTVYQGVVGQAPTFCTAASVIERIRSDQNVKEVIDTLRSLNQKDYQREKKLLPSIVWAGTAPTREAVVEANNLIVIDIDHLGAFEDATRVRDLVGQDPSCFNAFVSPSGVGVKAVFHFDPSGTTHKGVFQALKLYLKQQYRLTIDKSGSDPERLCLLSYDPGVKVNENAIPFIAKKAGVEVQKNLAELKVSKAGVRNSSLNIAAYRMGAEVREGVLTKDEAVHRLKIVAADIGLDDDEIEATIQSGLEAGINKATAASSGKAKKPAPCEFADAYLRARWKTTEGKTTLVHYRGDFWGWNQDDLWNVVSDTEIENSIVNWLTTVDPGYSTQTNRNNLIRTVQAVVAIPAAMTEPVRITEFEHIPLDFTINFANLCYNVKAGSFAKPSPELFYKIKHDYNLTPDAKCPRWLRFLNETLNEEKARDLLQEIFGYCLTNYTRFQKIFILQGPGANGKSVCLDVLKMVVGVDNCSSIPMHQIGAQFSGVHLTEKLVNIGTELKFSGREKTVAEDVLKLVSGGESMYVERKYKDGYSAKTTARLVFAANELPQIDDRSNGVWRRLVFLPFKNTISESDQDPELLEKLAAEVEGIAAWALEGLLRLLANNKFSHCVSGAELKEDHMRECSPELDWIEDNIKVEMGSKISYRDLNLKYKISNTALNEKYAISGKRLIRSILKVYPHAERTAVKVNKRMDKALQNLTWQEGV